jgi:hypothetical protein
VAAADGTAGVAGRLSGAARIAIRRPGGAFAAAVDLGRTDQAPALAAAPGGWIVAASTGNRSLTATTFKPDGQVARAVLDRGSSLGAPRAALTPDGVATVAWTARTFPLARRFAEFRGSWGAATPLPGGSGTRATDGGLALATAPSGRRLLAWAADDGIRVLVDGEPPAIVAPMTDGAAVSAALADDGSALVTFAGADNALFAADRGPGGAWTGPHRLSLDAQGQLPDFSVLDGIPPVGTVVASGGQAGAAWTVEGRIAAATGYAGGAWDPAVLVSSPVRDAFQFSLSQNGLLWTESNGPSPAATIRGARRAASAPADPVAPTFSARLPRRLPSTRTGRLTIPLRLRCDETCDVRLQAGSEESVARTVAAGRSVTIRLRAAADLLTAGDKRIALKLLVADRAGNVVRRGYTVRVRVLERPIRSFKVSLDHDFEMFSAAGNRAVARFVNNMIDRLASGTLDTRRAFRRPYDAGIDRIERVHDEITDTAVLDAIAEALTVPAARAGLATEDLFTSV